MNWPNAVPSSASHPQPADIEAPGVEEAQPGDLDRQLIDMIRGNWVTQMIHVAAELGLPDQLADGEKAIDQLADACCVNPDALYRLMRALASLRIFRETRQRCFALTPLADKLRSDRPGSLRQYARMQGAERYLCWADLLQSIRTGSSAFRHRFGQSVFDWHQDHPHQAAIFHAAMAEFSSFEAAAILTAFDFSPYAHLVDVGGGNGLLLKTILGHFGHMSATLLDLPDVVARVEIPEELQQRLETSPGDFFKGVPGGASAYLLKNVLHDWGDDACITILRQVAAAIREGNGHCLILEQVIASGNESCPGKLLDLHMLVTHEGGRERTAEEFAALLAAVGLRIRSIQETGCPIRVIVATT